MFPIKFKPTAEQLSAKTFPIGIEFKPSGEQLIEESLLPWAKGEKLEWEGIVEKQMYGENFPCEPWKVFSDIESSYHSKMEEKGAIKYTIHAFTTLLRASNSKRVSRRAGKGTWGGQTGSRRSKTPKPDASSANRRC
ncbi:hypothetical protein SASPL_139384 [Salvia splendens]|uniref:NAC domain-containing protein n=1 Tax=Salvia splendens TaxID=180675 RepID=A0A8X8ZBG7_SALSN|nr:hypothetical protein SASPL_139384 [Salvia splendens]